MNTQLIVVVRDTPSAILSGVGGHSRPITVVENLSVAVSVIVVHPINDREVITLSTIEEGDIVNSMAISIGTNDMIASELFKV